MVPRSKKRNSADSQQWLLKSFKKNKKIWLRQFTLVSTEFLLYSLVVYNWIYKNIERIVAIFIDCCMLGFGIMIIERVKGLAKKDNSMTFSSAFRHFVFVSWAFLKKRKRIFSCNQDENSKWLSFHFSIVSLPSSK